MSIRSIILFILSVTLTIFFFYNWEVAFVTMFSLVWLTFGMIYHNNTPHSHISVDRYYKQCCDRSLSRLLDKYCKKHDNPLSKLNNIEHEWKLDVQQRLHMYLCSDGNIWSIDLKKCFNNKMKWHCQVYYISDKQATKIYLNDVNFEYLLKEWNTKHNKFKNNAIDYAIEVEIEDTIFKCNN